MINLWHPATPIYVAFVLMAQLWVTRAEDRYYRQYTKRTGVELPTSNDYRRALLAPWRVITGSWLTKAATAQFKRQSDPELEHLRQRFLWRRRIAFALDFVGFFILVNMLFAAVK